LLAHVMEQPPAPSELNPNCPPVLEQVILRALKKSANERYADMQEMVEALKAILATPAPQIEASLKQQTAPPPAEAEKAEPAAEEAEESGGGFFSSVRKLFGGGKPEKKEGDTASRTAPRPQVEVPDEDSSIEEEYEGTMQLDLSGYSAEPGARLIMQDKNIVIDVPDKRTVVVGRTYRNNVVDLDLEPYEASKLGVSRNHARMTKQGDAWMLEDLGSLNGTFVNNVEVKEGNPVALKDGDAVRFSHMSFVFMQS